MRMPGRLLAHNSWLIAALLGLVWTLSASAQTSTIATATPASASSGTPSTFTIRQQILAQQQAALASQIRVATQCIADASKPATLRDPQGNINLVPQLDVINCARQLRTLRRQQASLARQVQKLASDADAASLRLQRQQETAKRALRTKWITGD